MAAISSNGTGGGDWSATASWSGGVVPGDGDNVTIDSGDTITVDQNLVIGDDTGTCLTVNGILDVPHDIGADYSITLKGNYAGSGEWKIGSSANPLASASSYTIKINAYDASPSARKYSLTVPTNGTLSWYGAIKTLDTTLTADANSAQAVASMANVDGWKVGDIIVLVDESDKTKTEELVIQSISSLDVTFTTNITNTKTSGWFVANMSANIRVKNFDDSYKSYLELSGIASSQNVLSYVMFDTLGDSTKYGLVLGRASTNNTNNDFIVFSYKCYSIKFDASTDCEAINTYLNSFALRPTNESNFRKINSINTNDSHIEGFNNTNSRFRILNLFGGGDGIDMQSGYLEIDNIYCTCTGNYGLSGNSCNFKIGNATIKGCTYGIDLSITGNNYTIKNLVCSSNSSADIRTGTVDASNATLVCENMKLNSTTPFTYNKDGDVIIATNYDYDGIAGTGTRGYSRYIGFNTILESDRSTFRTSAPSLKALINGTMKKVLSGISRTLYVTDTKSYTLNLYTYKNIASYGATATLRIAKGTDGHGLSETAEHDIMPTGTTSWQLKSLSLGTATSDGFVELELVVTKGVSTWILNIDDLDLIET